MNINRLKIGDRVMLKVARGKRRGQTLTGTIVSIGSELVGVQWDEYPLAEAYTLAGIEHEFLLYSAKRLS
jgi:hypothetical protein